MKIKPNRKKWAFKMKKPTKEEKITFFEVVGIEPQKSKQLFDITPPPIKPGLFVIEPINTDMVKFMKDETMTVDVKKNWEQYRTMETHPLNKANRKQKKAKALFSIYASKGTVIGFSDPKIHRIIYEDEFHLEEEIIKEKRKELTTGSYYEYGLFVGFISLPNSQKH